MTTKDKNKEAIKVRLNTMLINLQNEKIVSNFHIREDVFGKINIEIDAQAREPHNIETISL